MSGRKLLLDLPSREPALGFSDTAAALARIIAQSDPRFAVGIFGGWGSGKTTLMEAIERCLGDTGVVSVKFSAWRYEREEHLIVPLLDTIRQALLEWAVDRPERPLARRTAKKVGHVMTSLVAGTSVKLGVPGAIDISFEANKALLAHRSRLRPNDSAEVVPRSSYHASFRALREAFGSFVQEDERNVRRIVVFIDDLDRCLPESALQVLESMKLFFDLPGFVFVVGLDQAVVEYVIDTKYSRSEIEGADRAAPPISGSEYVKKIFQLPYRLAPVAIAQLEEFLSAAYDEAGISREQRAELDKDVAPHLSWVVGDSSVNPREIKRFINAYTLLTEVDSGGRLKRGAVLALQTILFRSDWRQVQDALFAYQDLFIDALVRQLAAEPDALGDLDPELESIPDDFLEYVARDAPGHSLLEVGELGPYLSSGGAVLSTQNPALLDALRSVGTVRRLLREVTRDPRGIEGAAEEITRAVALVERPVAAFGSGPLQQGVLRDLDEFRKLLHSLDGTARGVRDTPLRSPSPEEEQGNAALSVLATNIAQRLRRMYRQGDVVTRRATSSGPSSSSVDAGEAQ